MPSGTTSLPIPSPGMTAIFCFFMTSVLHSPLVNGGALDGAEDQVLDAEADEDDGEEPGEDAGRLELVLVLEDDPPQAAGAAAHAEDELRGDQRAPGEGPADLEPGEDPGQRRRHQDLGHVAHSGEAVVAADHAQRDRKSTR